MYPSDQTGSAVYETNAINSDLKNVGNLTDNYLLTTIIARI